MGEQWVLVRFHREPLCILQFTQGCSAAKLAATIAQRFSDGILEHIAADSLADGGRSSLATIAEPCPRLNDSALPTLTAAVCTRNGANRIAECLDALARLEYPPGLLDVIVVDNAPDDDETRHIVERFPSIRYVVEPTPGLDWARNRAIAEARG